MIHWTELARFVKDKEKSLKSKPRITWEHIEEVLPDGRYVVKGYTVPAIGQKKFSQGERVPVWWERGRIKGILGHSWRRAKFIPDVTLIPGDIQTVAGFIDTEKGGNTYGGGVFLVVASATSGPVALPLVNLGISLKNPTDARAKWVEGDSTTVCFIVKAEDINGVAVQHAILISIPRGPTATIIPLDKEAKPLTVSVNEVEMPVMKASLLKHYTFTPSTTLVRTVQVDVKCNIRLWRFISQAVAVGNPLPTPGSFSEWLSVHIEEDGNYTATGLPVRISLGASCQEFFAVPVENSEDVDIQLVYSEPDDWRPDQVRESEAVFVADEFGHFTQSFAALPPFHMSWPITLGDPTPLLKDFYEYVGFGFQFQDDPAVGWPPVPSTFLSWGDDQRPEGSTDLNAQDTIFRLPHVYMYNARTAAVEARNVEASTVLTVQGYRYLNTTWCASTWDARYGCAVDLAPYDFATPTYDSLVGPLLGWGAAGPPADAWPNPWNSIRHPRVGQGGGSNFAGSTDGGLTYGFQAAAEPWQGWGQFALWKETLSRDADVLTPPDIAWGVSLTGFSNPYLVDPWKTEFADNMQIIQMSTRYKLDPMSDFAYAFSSIVAHDQVPGGFSFPADVLDAVARGGQFVHPKVDADGTILSTGYFGGTWPIDGVTRYLIRQTGTNIASYGATVPGSTDASGGSHGDLDIAARYIRVPRGNPLPNGFTAEVKTVVGDGGWVKTGVVAYRVSIERTIDKIVPPSLITFFNREFPACPPLLVEIESVKNSVDLTWTPVPGATAYTVYRKDPESSDYYKVARLSQPAYTDLGSRLDTIMPTASELGKSGAGSFGGAILQDYYGKGVLLLVRAITGTPSLIRVAKTGAYETVATLSTFTPVILRVNTKWVVAAKGDTNKLVVIDIATGTAYPVNEDNITVLQNNGTITSIDSTNLMPTKTRIFWVDPDDRFNRRLLHTAFDDDKKQYLWHLRDDVKRPTHKKFPFGTFRTSVLFPSRIESQT